MAECEHLTRTTAYFDGALASDDEAAAVEHLATCAACQQVLGDAVAIDAVLASEPARAAQVASPAPPRRRHRWVPVVALAGALAAAAAVISLVRSGDPPRDAVAIELPRERAVEARFTSERFGAHRPLAVLRGDRAHEAISLATLAAIEARGATPELIAALAASGDLARATQLAEQLAVDADGETDRAALALAARDAERGLVHATRARDRAPQSAAAAWNFGLAARDLGLWRVARAAFAQVADAGEPGWRDEARAQLEALDRELAPALGFADFDARARAMVNGGPPITLDDVRRYPAFARVYLLDALRVLADVEPLRPLARELDALAGTTTATAAVDRAAAADPRVRARFAARYRAVVARTATPDEIARLIADLRGAGVPAADLLAGTIITGSRWMAELALLERTVAPWQDPWFDVFVERAKIRTRFGGAAGDNRAQPALEALHARCPGAASLRCGQVAQDLAEVLFSSGRPDTAQRWAQRAVDDYARAMSPTHVQTARTLLAQIHRTMGRDELARAELEEVVLAEPRCTLARYARILRADLALTAGRWDAARTALPDATPPAGCGADDDLQAVMTATDLARRTGEPADRALAERWIAAATASADPYGDGIARIGRARITPDADPAPLHAWLAAHPHVPDDPRRDNVRAWAVTTLISDAGARGDWADVIASARLEGPIGAPACTAVASVDDGTITVAVADAAGTTGAQRRVEPIEIATTTIIPDPLQQRLRACAGIALIARAPLHGRANLLAPELPWWFAGGAPPRPRGAPARALEVTSPTTPELELPPLPAPGPSALPFAQRLAGRDATPRRVLAALADATYAELHVHGIATAHDPAAAYLALAPDPDGTFALRADALARAKLAAAPLVVLAACRAAAVNPLLRERWSLPDAFLVAGASAVVAVDVPIPDAAARPIFDELRRRVDAGVPVEQAVAELRRGASADWVRRLAVFR